MKRNLNILLSLFMLTSMVLAACGPAATAAPTPTIVAPVPTLAPTCPPSGWIPDVGNSRTMQLSETIKVELTFDGYNQVTYKVYANITLIKEVTDTVLESSFGTLSINFIESDNVLGFAIIIVGFCISNNGTGQMYDLERITPDSPSVIG